MTTYFVSSEIGRDNNAGTSATSPLATLQAAENLVKPGDTVEVMSGTYTGPGGGNVLTITTSGTASAPITFEAAPGATPIIDSSGTWQGIEIDASYITINGFTIVGDAANFTLAQAMAGYSTGDPELDGNGIAATSGALVHNLIIENNTIYNEPGAGIGINNGDYIQILNNNVHDNAHWSAYGASGIEVGSSQNFDNAAGPHIIISGNTSVNNSELVPEYRANAITDGEGIILDSNNPYTGGFLVQNNTTSGNSGPGIETVFSDNAVITGNITTGDLTNPGLVSEGEIFNNQSNNITITNNITTSAPPPPPPGQLVVNGGFETHDFAGWSIGGNSAVISFGPQVYISTNAQSGQYAASLGSMGSDGSLSQSIQTTAGQHYTLDFWLANLEGGTNDFTVKWNGQSLLALTNAPAQGYTEYRFDVVGTAGTSQLEFDEREDISSWSLDSISVTATATGSGPPPPPPPAAPVITSFTPNTGGVDTTSTINLAGSAEAGSTVTVSDGGAVLGTALVNAAGAWTFVERNAANGTHTFTATDTDANGTSAASTAFSVPINVAGSPPPPPPPGSNLIVNGGFETNSFTGWTLSGNVAPLSFGPQAFIIGPSSPISSNAQSGQFAAGFGSMGTDGTLSQNIQTTAGQSYTVQFWLANASGGPDDFTAKWNGQTLLALKNTSAQGYTEYTYNVVGTAGTSNLEFDFRQDPSYWSLDSISVTPAGSDPPPPPAAPVITSFTPNTGGVDTTSTINLAGSAEAGSTVTVSDGGAVLGTALVNAAGAWTFVERNAANGTHTFTATDTDANGTSAASTAFSVPVNVAGSPPPPPPGSNLVVNGDFETNSFTGWTLSGNVAPLSFGPQAFIIGPSSPISSNAQSGQYAAGLGSMGTDGTLSQNIQTTAGQSYTVQFWLANASGGPDDFTAKWNGQTLVALKNAAAQGYTEYTYNVVGTAGTSNLEFDFRQDPSYLSLDNISVTAVGSQTNAQPSGITTSNGQTGASVNNALAQSNPAPSQNDSVGTMATLLSQYMATSNGSGASVSTPPVVAQSSPPPVTLVSPFHA